MTAAITTRLPAETRFLALTRVMAASLAAELGFSIDAIDDLRVAVDEIVSAAMDGAGDAGAIDLGFRVGDGELSVSVTVGDGAAVAIDALSRQILAAVTDELEIGPTSASFVCRRDPIGP
jgi:serine/threonine-protein kinase RsbW